MNHLVDLFLNMARLSIAAVVCHKRSRADHNIGNTALTAAVILSVVARKTFDQKPRIGCFAAHEHTLPRDKNIIENRQAFAADNTEFCVALVNLTFHFTVIICLTAKDMDYSRSVHRQCAADSIVCVIFLHSHGGHYQHFMGIDHPCHMRFRPTDNNTVFIFIHDMDKQIRICLLAWAQAAVTLRICHGAGNHQIVFLYIQKKLFKAFMVFCPHRLIHIIGNGIGRVHGVKSHTALIAGTCFLRDHAKHLDLFHQIADALMDMCKPVNFLPC
ncbi:hypothetical protein SDC9_156286 [bioreactor metagenome]|uniref:Uncharacterized protein n=1 Tax=bioreactor metagenome TaxID=1076179 RepID=A0A645F3S5_9ZZZZ